VLAGLGILWCAWVDSVRCPVLGWWRGEPFFEGMPASYYANVFRRVRRPSGGDEVARFLGAVSQRAEKWWELDNRRLDMMEDHPEAVPVLRWLVRDSDEDVQFCALWYLREQGPAAHAALDAVLSGIEDKYAPNRVMAIVVMARLDPSRKPEAARLLNEDVREGRNPHGIASMGFVELYLDRYHYRRAFEVLLGAVGQPHPCPQVTAALAAGVEIQLGARYDSARPGP
jgi:hypothetical protein